MRTRLFYLLLTLSALALTACGSGDPSVSDENSFGLGPRPAFEDNGSSLRCRSTRNLDDNQLLVSVQTPSTSPDARKGSSLANTTSTDLTLVDLNGSLSRALQQETNDGDFIVTFEDPIPRRIDRAIEATVGGTTYRAPVASECGHVFVNPFSDVLIDEVARDLTSSEIDSINNCDEVACTYDLVWQTMADRVQSFEINVSDGQSALKDRKDFMAFLDHGESLLTQDEAELQSDNQDDVAPAFNTVQFGVSLNNSQQNGGFWATHTIARGSSTANGGTSYTYPGYSIGNLEFANLGFDLALGTVDVPFTRSSFGFSALDPAFRSYSTQSNQLYQSGNGNIFSSLRPLLQTVSDVGTRTIGWAPNPHIHTASAERTDREAPQAMLSNYFHAAKAWELSGSEEEGYNRQKLLEEHAITNVEINLSEWDDSINRFSTDEEYRFIGFELKPDTAGGIKRATARTGTWTMDSNTNTGSETSVTEWFLANTSPTAYSKFEFESVKQKVTPNEIREPFLGNLFFTYPSFPLEGGTTSDRVPNAAVSPDGEWIALSARPGAGNQSGGSILRVARKASSIGPLPDAANYRIKGFSISSDTLSQYEDACLTVENSSVSYDFIKHQSSTDSNFTVADSGRESGSGCNIKGTDPFTIDGCSSGSAQFKGFTTDNGNTLVMITKSNESVGFLLGFRDDSAEGCPN